MITVIECGCAECYWPSDPVPLITAETFDTIEEAKAKYDITQGGRFPNNKWQPHPQGGEYYPHGQGAVWILPENIAKLEVDDGSDS